MSLVSLSAPVSQTAPRARVDQPLRIAFIGARGVGGTYSGIETYYEEVGERLAQRGHHVTAYCRRYFTPAVSQYRGIAVRRLPCLRTKHLETLSHSLLSTIDCAFRRFDIVQYHALGSAPLALIPRLLGKTTVVSVRGLDWQRAKWGGLARRILQLGEWASARVPHGTAVVSETLQAHYEREHGRRPQVIPNAIPKVPAPTDEVVRELGLVPGRYLLYSGRLSPEKGVDTLLEACRSLDERFEVVIAGGAGYDSSFKEKLHSLATPRTRFLGQVDRDLVQALLAHCYAYVLPSAMEGLSIALLEALGHGCCIVTSDIPENREVVGAAAKLFPYGDASRLREVLTCLVSDPELAADCRRRAQLRAVTRPGWDEITDRTESFYFHLLNAHKSRVGARVS